MANCRDCQFFVLKKGELLEGVCKRFPPVPSPTYPGSLSFFPATTVGGWCGEIKLNEEALNKSIEEFSERYSG